MGDTTVRVYDAHTGKFKRYEDAHGKPTTLEVAVVERDTTPAFCDDKGHLTLVAGPPHVFVESGRECPSCLTYMIPNEVAMVHRCTACGYEVPITTGELAK